MHQTRTSIADLPDDILPIIFSKLPGQDVRLLPLLSSRFQRLSEPAIQAMAASMLHAALPLTTPADWEKLSRVLKMHAHHITLDNWKGFLGAVADAGGSTVLVQLLLLAPSVGAGDADIVRFTGDMPLQLDQQDLPFLKELNATRRIGNSSSIQVVSNTAGNQLAQKMIASGLAHQFRFEGKRGNSSAGDQAPSCMPAGRTTLAAALEQLTPLEFAGALWHAGAWDQRDAGINAWIRGMVGAHLKKCAGSQEIAKLNLRCYISDPERKAPWFEMLAATGELGPAPGARPYLGTLFSQFFEYATRDNPAIPWREQVPAFARCALIAMASETPAGKGEFSFSKTLVKCGFITRKEAQDFVRKLEKRDPGSMPLAAAVRRWMEDRRAQ